MTSPTPQPLCLLKNRRSGFALALTIIILALVAVTAVAFLVTATTERSNASNYAHIEKAELLAEAGVNAAIARVTTEMQYRPYHAIGYRPVSVGTSANPLTEILPVITGPRTTDPAVATYNTAPVTTSDVYLVSTTGATATGPPGSLAPTNLDDTNSVDLNANHLSSEPKGWIGSPVTAAAPIPYRAPWVDVLRDPTRPQQPDPTTANYNPVIGRYAYWVEDETSKLDSSIVGNEDSGGGFKRGNGLVVTDLDVGALPLVGGSPLPTGDIPTNQAIIDFRSGQPIPDARFLNRVTKLASNVHETTKFYETCFSLSDDLAGTGRRRANLNALVTNTLDAPMIAGNIDDIAYVISGAHLFNNSGLGPTPTPGPSDHRVFKDAPTTTNALPTFGSRFFTSSAPTTDQANMYIERIAANIRDYIDSDSQPTYVDISDQVVSGSKPTFAWKSGSEPRAIGKEAIPYLQEVAWCGYQRKMEDIPGSSPKARSFDVDIDFYFEFMNPTTKDFVAPPGAFLKVYNGISFSKGSYGMLRYPDQEFQIGGMKFPAGAATVLTTVPTPQDDVPGLLLGTNVIRLTGAIRNFTGTTDEKIGSSVGLQLFGRDGGSNPPTYDYQTEAVWGTPNGVYEALGYLPAGGNNTYTWNMDGLASEMAPNKTRFVYSYSLRGNDDQSRTGDARSLSEQLQMLSGTSLGNDQTRFYADIQGDGNLPPPKGIPQKTTLGKAATTYVDTTRWPDYTPGLTDDSATAYAVVRDDAMQSIGELGNIYDPVRTIASASGSSILQARGGGRTLKVGQMDDRITGARFSTTWFNAAWRLTDLFSADLTKDSSDNYVKVSTPTSRGKININGVLRDDGMAFKSALRSLTFLLSPDGSQGMGGNTFSSSEIDKLISEIKSYLTTNGPFMERGEISQLTFFNGSAAETAGGSPLNIANDRGREELFRRCIEMVTTRSASFTVYALGQVIHQAKDGTKTPTGERRLAITFQLEPRKGATPLEASSAPYDAVDNYAVKRIYAPN
jgi:hypothetical protein